ncbi:MAG TPA: RusA family crossover junction endodeoxyribonuclease [Vulgatibacter sp.]|nr:RusA family crossover junction endodeoxyribonuclease [Vulgatibacter sp.]
MRLERSPEARARALLEALLQGHSPGRVIEVVHEGPPRPKERPRFDGRSGRAITGSRTKNQERWIGMRVAAAMKGQPFTGEVAVVMAFCLPDRRIRDADNLAKAAMDAATKGRAWVDDSQVTAQAALLELDAERPRTVLFIADRAPALGRKPADPTKQRKRRSARPVGLALGRRT